jgi:hypothetical protein
VKILRWGAVALALVVTTVACKDDAPEVTLIPTTRGTDLVPDTGSPDGGSGDTTPAEQVDTCSALSRAYFAATGASGAAEVVQPLYDDVTPLLPEAARADWALASAAFVAYEDAASEVPEGDEQLAVPEVRDAYDEARSDDVQAALQRVRDAMEADCPGIFD